MTPIAHKTLRLEDIEPSRSQAFSPNLYRYLKKHGHFYRDGGIAQDVFVARAGTAAAKSFGEGNQLLGYFDLKCFIGVRLIEALCKGAKAQSSAYFCSNADFDFAPNFWDEYLRLGRCAIDPDHKEYFIDVRYHEKGKQQVCLWCSKVVNIPMA